MSFVFDDASCQSVADAQRPAPKARAAPKHSFDAIIMMPARWRVYASVALRRKQRLRRKEACAQVRSSRTTARYADMLTSLHSGEAERRAKWQARQAFFRNIMSANMMADACRKDMQNNTMIRVICCQALYAPEAVRGEQPTTSRYL